MLLQNMNFKWGIYLTIFFITAAIAGSTAAATTAPPSEATPSETGNGNGGGASSASVANTPNAANSASSGGPAAPAPSAANPPASTSYQGSTLNVHPFLSSMVNYTTPQKFQGKNSRELKYEDEKAKILSNKRLYLPGFQL